MTLTAPWLHPLIMREGEGEGAGGDPAPAPAAAPASGSTSIFTPTAAPAEGDSAAASAAWEGPDWVAEKYRGAESPIEAQAQAYSEAMKKLSQKTDDLREGVEAEIKESLTAEIKAEFAAERGAPDGPDGYSYGEDINPPSEEIDTAFRGWAKKHELSQEAFDEAVGLFGSTQIDHAAERELLGANADARVAAMNDWGSKNIPVELHAAASEAMQTAAGFELFEHFMSKGRDAGYSPGAGTPPAQLTRDSLRQRQADPRYSDPTKRDEGFVRSVQADWERFARQEDAKARR